MSAHRPQQTKHTSRCPSRPFLQHRSLPLLEWTQLDAKVQKNIIFEPVAMVSIICLLIFTVWD